MTSSFSLGLQVGRRPERSRPAGPQVVDLDAANLSSGENFASAVVACSQASVEDVLDARKLIFEYQRRIDATTNRMTAQLTVYAYAIGSLLTQIALKGLHEQAGASSLTDLINKQEFWEDQGIALQSRQLFTYKKVAEGIDRYRQLIDQICDSGELPEGVLTEAMAIGIDIEDLRSSVMKGYVDKLTNLLELGVSKIEQVLRLGETTAHTALLTGQVTTSEGPLHLDKTPIRELRSRISITQRQAASSPNILVKDKQVQVSPLIGRIEREVSRLENTFDQLSMPDRERLALLTNRLLALFGEPSQV